MAFLPAVEAKSFFDASRSLRGGYSDSKNPFHTNLNGGALRAPPNTVGIALSFGGVINSTYPWLQNRPLGHVMWFTGRRDMAKSKQ